MYTLYIQYTQRERERERERETKKDKQSKLSIEDRFLITTEKIQIEACLIRAQIMTRS